MGKEFGRFADEVDFLSGSAAGLPRAAFHPCLFVNEQIGRDEDEKNN